MAYGRKVGEHERVISFGKIDWYGRGRKINEVTVEIRYEPRGNEPILVNHEPTGERTPAYWEFAVSAMVYNSQRTDIVAGGQCLDEINPHLRRDGLWRCIYRLWKLYHLNGMRAGTPEQMEAIAEFRKNNENPSYKAECEHLKELGLYEVNFTGKTIGREYHNEPYKYGHGFVIQEIPEEDQKKIRMLIHGYLDQ